jgi:hypothetical protein
MRGSLAQFKSCLCCNRFDIGRPSHAVGAENFLFAAHLFNRKMTGGAANDKAQTGKKQPSDLRLGQGETCSTATVEGLMARTLISGGATA